MIKFFQKNWRVLAWTAIFTVFFIRCFFMLDPDFGWHLRLGEIILTQGFPKTDPFSYSMPSYPFADYQWGSDVLIFVVHKFTGIIGLSILYSLIGIAALWIVLNKKQIYSMIPLFFAASVMTSAIGIRPQVISWLFVSILFWLMTDEKTWKKWKWALPILIILWVNLHGSFPLGLILASLIIIFKSVQTRKFHLQDLIVLLISISTTLLNPYGWKNVYEVLKQIILAGPLMRQGISEWAPSYMAPSMSFLILIALGAILALRYRKKIGWDKISSCLLLALSGLASLRNIPFFAVTGGPLLYSLLSETEKEAKKVNTIKRFEIFTKAFLFFAILVFLGEGIVGISRAQRLSEEQFYPKKAVEFLKEQSFSGRLFSEYKWGGYLIWKYPEKKVYIDGRMSNFIWEGTKKETGYAFQEYTKLKNGEIDLKEFVNRYEIKLALLPIRPPTEPKLIKFYKDITGFDSIQQKSFKNRFEELGWKKVYSDKTAIIFQKEEN